MYFLHYTYIYSITKQYMIPKKIIVIIQQAIKQNHP